ncbi:RNA polymerase factor sigma-54 [Trinickia terrae]|uniref:RNA polymerase sigma-54 factor n=1 Tax=Trinickia terrae TaxID=2571161 RepID=A0A4U1HP13_9BURK|nr:RNA polymerase factor sigma-54 [Trinickia terrae]TKC83082.1 RNA polymerase factor sigma-54 [Trinickia terrae]
MPPILELHQKQHVALTPRLQQSVRLLQLSSLEFQHELRQALDSNPFLELDEPAQEDAEPAADAAGELHAAYDAGAAPVPDSPSADTAALAAPDEPAGEYTNEYVNEYANDWPGGTLARPHGDSEDADPGAWAHSQPTMHEQLHVLLNVYPLNDRDHAVAQMVIEALDDDGYLREPLAELAQVCKAEPPLAEEELRVALRLVQTLDKPGVGARSLAECLSLQLQALQEDTPGRALALEIAEHHLERLARREHAELQKQLGCSADALRVASLLVRRLDPKPGEAYVPDADNYVVPDVIVRQVRNQWAVTVNPAVLPRTRIHRLYAEMFAQAPGTSGSPLAQQLQEARWLLRNAEQRFTTIQRVAECIVAHQKAFFDYGEIALKPLVLREVADELGLHESTVSRASSNKYMATPRGIFEFRHFFPRKLATETGGRCSAAAVRAVIKELIAQEDVHDPLSDVSLAKLLTQEGMIVARRTVAKYRNQMKVPPAQLRQR